MPNTDYKYKEQWEREKREREARARQREEYEAEKYKRNSVAALIIITYWLTAIGLGYLFYQKFPHLTAWQAYAIIWTVGVVIAGWTVYLYFKGGKWIKEHWLTEPWDLGWWVGLILGYALVISLGWIWAFYMIDPAAQATSSGPSFQIIAVAAILVLVCLAFPTVGIPVLFLLLLVLLKSWS